MSLFNPSGKRQSSGPDDFEYIKAPCKPGAMYGTVIKVSDVYPPGQYDKGDVILIYVKLLNDDGTEQVMTIKEMDIKTKQEVPRVVPRIISCRRGAVFQQPSNSNYQGMFGIIEMAGTLDYSFAIEEVLSKLPKTEANEVLSNLVFAEFVRQSLMGRKVLVDVVNSEAAKCKGGQSYAKLAKFLRVEGPVPVITVQGIGDIATKNLPRAMERHAQDAQKAKPAPQADAASAFQAAAAMQANVQANQAFQGADKVAPQAQTTLPPAPAPAPAPAAPVNENAKVLLTRMRMAVTEYLKMVAEADEKTQVVMKTKGISEKDITDRMKTHHFSDEEIAVVFRSLHATGSMSIPRKGHFLLIVEKPEDVTVDDAVTCVEAMEAEGA